ncbi:cryptochrome/photolyase family protein [uncultured Pseudacidovorax sp.]|uniref:cryptochrome/photolyase family protein n=1 Tax=uncultured Pseudacidovorax sp. TaxID=679313 RepID=UPI0025FCDABE|nr:cryptochrome/photolyase family protein [uncultured Pseudacidovorax sp.]
MTLRHLVLVLGDQLDPEASGFDGFDPAQDAVWMAEVDDEASHVWSIQPRIAIFLAAMRHFAQALVKAGRTVHYTRLDGEGNRGSLAAELELAIRTHRPQCLVMTAPGEHRVLKALQAVAAAEGVPLEIREDRHFFCTVREFAAHARGRRQLRMEFFYREQRRRHGVLMDGDEPVGGQWNYDADNRAAFGKAGPGRVPEAPAFRPDPLTQDVLDMVAARFADRPGNLANFAWPVTRAQALEALDDFVRHRLVDFGHWQDAMWPGEPWLWHSRLSAAMNLKLLHPREVVEAAEKAYRAGHVPLASAEGFIRQILGWREYVRGIYWTRMPRYLELNALGAREPLPGFYWTGDTPMACLADAVGQTLEHGYAHHIQRLMVTGLYALLLGVEPQQVHAWYLAVYVDAVEWVELPNTLGMSQFGDGGLMGSKPYVATGRYIERMSAGSLCGRCRFKPAERLGDDACPFTTLYWDFLVRHEERLASNPRMTLQLRNLQRLDADERRRIAERSAAIRRGEVDA